MPAGHLWRYTVVGVNTNQELERERERERGVLLNACYTTGTVFGVGNTVKR